MGALADGQGKGPSFVEGGKRGTYVHDDPVRIRVEGEGDARYEAASAREVRGEGVDIGHLRRRASVGLNRGSTETMKQVGE